MTCFIYSFSSSKMGDYEKLSILKQIFKYVNVKDFPVLDGDTFEQIHERFISMLDKLLDKIPQNTKRNYINFVIDNKVIPLVPVAPKQEEYDGHHRKEQFQKDLSEHDRMYNLSKEEKEAFSRYTYFYDEIINGKLNRSGERREGGERSVKLDKYTKNIVDTMVSTLNRLEDEGVANNFQYLYRGVTKPHLNGEYLYNPGFMSKTSSFSIASNFSQDMMDFASTGYVYVFDDNTVLQLPIYPFSALSFEMEYLSYPGERYEVVDQYLLFTQRARGSYLTKLYYCHYVDVRLPRIIEDIELTREIENEVLLLREVIGEEVKKGLTVFVENQPGDYLLIFSQGRIILNENVEISEEEKNRKVFEIAYLNVVLPGRHSYSVKVSEQEYAEGDLDGVAYEELHSEYKETVYSSSY